MCRGKRGDIEEEDDQESYFKWLEENPNAGLTSNDDEQQQQQQDVDYDEEGNMIAPEKSKFIDPLPPVDHSAIEYEPFQKNFYHEHADIAALSKERVDALRRTLGIKVSLSFPSTLSFNKLQYCLALLVKRASTLEFSLVSLSFAQRVSL